MTKTRTKTPSVYDVCAEQNDFALLRDGRYLMTPNGKPFSVPSRPLAEVIAEEWRTQGEKIIPSTMPMTQLAATALDIISRDREKIIAALLAYTDSDLLCHFAETPEALAEKQRLTWQPYLDWCTTRYHVHFVTGCGVMPIKQNELTRIRLGDVLTAMDDLNLAGLSSATDSTGSLVLGLALTEGFANAQSILTASVLDTDHQAIRWGVDPVTQARHTTILKDLEDCAQWFALLRA